MRLTLLPPSPTRSGTADAVVAEDAAPSDAVDFEPEIGSMATNAEMESNAESSVLNNIEEYIQPEKGWMHPAY